MTFSHSCGIFISIVEMITSESRKMILQTLQEICALIDYNFDYIIYDNACHLDETLKINAENYSRLKNVKCYIDRFHQVNHKQSKCKTVYNIDTNSNLKNINSQICEQQFFKLNTFKHNVKHMSKNHFLFYFLCILDRMNTELIQKMILQNK
jgi:hypothetical protein